MKSKAICVVKLGSLVLPVTRFADGRYCISYTLGTERKRSTSTNLELIKGEAERVLIAIGNGQMDACDLTGRDARIYIAAKQALAEGRIEMEVDAAARILAQAAKILGCDVTRLLEAARYYSTAELTADTNITVDKVLEEFLRPKETALANGDLSEIHVAKLGEDLSKFAAAFPQPMVSIRAGEIQDWLNSRPVGPRRRRNLRDKIIALFNFARDRRYIPNSLKTEAEKTDRPKIRKGAEPTFTAREMQVLLDNAPQELLPYLAIGAFAGLRGSEIMRLNWSSVRWEQSVIIVQGYEARKTGHRRTVEMRENLIAWLKPWRERHSGRIVEEGHGRIDNLVRRHSQKYGLKWQRNVLRSSYGSYLTALTSDIGHVSIQMGNSPGVVRRDYLEAKTKREAEEYFGVIPPGSANNVIELDLGLRWNVT